MRQALQCLSAHRFPPMYVMSRDDGLDCLPRPSLIHSLNLPRAQARLGAYTVPRTHEVSPHPPVSLRMWGGGIPPPQYTGRTGGGGEAVHCTATFITLSSFHTHPHRFHFPNEPHQMYWPGRYLYEGGMGTRGPSPLTLTTSYTGTKEFMRRWVPVMVSLYNRLFARSINTRRRGMGGIFLPWSKGLINVNIT